MTTQSADELFDEGLERYKAGESIATLIPTFKSVCDRTKKNSSAFTCLAWLYLLNDEPALALATAQKAVKLNPQDPQARVNLALAMLDSGKKGVRESCRSPKKCRKKSCTISPMDSPANPTGKAWSGSKPGCWSSLSRTHLPTPDRRCGKILPFNQDLHGRCTRSGEVPADFNRVAGAPVNHQVPGIIG
jgi:hypothetical protein